MIISIEYWKWDKNRFFYGKNISYRELIAQMEFIEAEYDRAEDNFEDMMCRVYGWTEYFPENEDDYRDICPEYRYDRDICKLFKIRYDDDQD